MGRYICIGSEEESALSKFSWIFNYGEDFFGFKICFHEYISYLAPLRIFGIPHQVFEPKIKTLNPIDSIKPGIIIHKGLIIVELIYKSELYGKPRQVACYFDDFFDGDFQGFIANKQLRIESINCIFFDDKIGIFTKTEIKGISIQYNVSGKSLPIPHMSNQKLGIPLQQSGFKIVEGDYIAEIYCNKF